jgi:hypothetical protein
MYFEHVAGPAGAGRPGDAAPPPGFPDTLPAGAARGFALGDPTSGLTLLEQLDAGPDRGRDPRTWWALYDGDTRSDVWSFQPSTASGGDGKVLTDYHFDSAERRDDQLFVRITGSGHLNGARSWSVGEELTFEVTPAGLALLRVRNAWTTSSDLGLRVEREVGDTFVSTEVVVSDDVLARCGLVLVGDYQVGAPGPWADQERAFTCAIERSKNRSTRSTERSRDSRSFVERAR